MQNNKHFDERFCGAGAKDIEQETSDLVPLDSISYNYDQRLKEGHRTKCGVIALRGFFSILHFGNHFHKDKRP